MNKTLSVAPHIPCTPVDLQSNIDTNVIAAKTYPPPSSATLGDFLCPSLYSSYLRV
jgi:hypothetical protein